ncbi:Ubiquinone/menaquinone biosynthesis C-methyltransferase UbiE [Pedobacter sp. Bi27]|uniref:class I SAM-dependent methyltransferase n=1 Tax=unclassified Pedobacter TaxID=2628915 RepID=UPI001DB82E34|nr:MULTISPECIES: class I SAM-dependent methyltransferase [unclassified Pedobacter]CAH0257713.1 Ubiquinone/menaquinone biosynthesis C-methyltransferase UbiE [Pedobacter sp. Bi36]CAH0284893.1 Ubiquinone/menaquinone biosynthesis C-methyltransferase UbiE [Pedobacter sp. Bi126]CAH0288295.1 Ubiquinone/menaquinone biosynthesis C-methyltransferase UbiE [Pedobacter sp. Bi27]
MEEQEDLNTLTQDQKTDVLPPKNTLIFKLLQDLPLKAEEKVLEIGPAGTEHLSYLFQKAKNISYSGTYPTESAMKEASLTYKADGNAAEFIKTTDNKLNFQDNFFDYCFTANTIYFWPDPLKYLAESYRVLKPGGKTDLAFVEKNSGGDLPWTQLDFTFYEIDEVKSFFELSGFANIEVKKMMEMVMDQNGKEISKPFIVVSGRK